VVWPHSTRSPSILPLFPFSKVISQTKPYGTRYYGPVDSMFQIFAIFRSDKSWTIQAESCHNSDHNTQHQRGQSRLYKPQSYHLGYFPVIIGLRNVRTIKHYYPQSYCNGRSPIVIGWRIVQFLSVILLQRENTH